MAKRKNKKNIKHPEWYVLVEDINDRKIVKFNVFNHYGFTYSLFDEVFKYLKKHGNNPFNTEEFDDDLKKIIRSNLMYYYWSKCEWEIIITCFPPYDKFNELKTDVFEQVMLNYDAFFKYVRKQALELFYGYKVKTIKQYIEILDKLQL